MKKAAKKPKLRSTAESVGLGNANSSKPKDERRQSIETRKIKNGFIVRQSGHLDNEYDSEETYHPKKPKIQVGVKAQAARKARLKDVPL